MTIICDPPRKYSKRGSRWAHVTSTDIHELKDYAFRQGLRRRDSKPWIHYDVTEDELKKLPGITMVTRREMATTMRRFRQPTK